MKRPKVTWDVTIIVSGIKRKYMAERVAKDLEKAVHLYYKDFRDIVTLEERKENDSDKRITL